MCITVAVINALVGAVFMIAGRSVTDLPSSVIALGAGLALIYAKQMKEQLVVGIVAIFVVLIKSIVY